MTGSTQKRAIENYRKRLKASGLARFEVLGRAADRALIRAIAKRLAENDQKAGQLREAVSCHVGGDELQKGGILAGLRRSPLVGAELDLTRDATTGRPVDL